MAVRQQPGQGSHRKPLQSRAIASATGLNSAASRLLIIAMLLTGCGGEEPYQSRNEPPSQVAAALKSPVTRPIPHCTLREALDQLSEDFDVTIRFSQRDDEKLPDYVPAKLLLVEVEMPITGVSLEQALVLILGQVSCDYVVDSERIVVDVQRLTDQPIVTQPYPVADLLGRGPVVQFEDPQDLLGYSPSIPPNYQSNAQFTSIDGAWLIEALKLLTRDESSWPSGGIELYGETLLISNKKRVHQRIVDALELMRKLARSNASDPLVLPGSAAVASDDLAASLQQRVDWTIPSECSVEQLVEQFREGFGLKLVLDRSSFVRLERDVTRQERWVRDVSAGPLKNVAVGELLDIVFSASKCEIVRRGNAIVIAAQGFNYWRDKELILKAYPAPWIGDHPGGVNKSSHPDLARLAELSALTEGEALAVPGGMIALASAMDHREITQAFSQLRRALNVADMDYDPRPPNPVTRAMSDKLAQIVDVKFDDVPISQALAQIQKDYDIENLVFDWLDLGEPFWRTLSLNGRARSLTAPTTVDLKGVSLRAAINHVLASADKDFPAARVAIRDNMLVIQGIEDWPAHSREWRVFRAAGIPGLLNEDLTEVFQLNLDCGWSDDGTGQGSLVPFTNAVAIAQPEWRYEQITRLLDLAQALSDPANADKSVLHANSRTPSEKKLNAVLSQRMDFSVPEDYTLASLAEKLRGDFGINVVINHRSLDENSAWDKGLDSPLRSPPVAFEFHDLQLSEILDYLLESFDCRHVIRDEALMIVDFESSEIAMETRGYPLPWQKESQQFGWYTFIDAVEGMYFDLVEPWPSEGWLNEGSGEGIAEYAPGGLLITQTAVMHRGLELQVQDMTAMQMPEQEISTSHRRTGWLLERLEERVDVNFQAVPLSAALRQLQSEFSIPNIFFAWESIAEISPSSQKLRERLLQSPITVQLSDVTLRTALHQMVEDAIDHLGDTAEKPTRHLKKPPGAYNPFDADEGYPLIDLHVGEGSVMVTVDNELLSPRNYRLSPAALQAGGGIDSVINALQSTVGQNWLDEGTGPATIDEIDHVLLISQTPEAHVQTQAFVDLLENSNDGPRLQGQTLSHSPADDAIAEALGERLTITIEDQPLDQAFATLLQAAGISNAIVSENSLRAMAVEPRDTRVSLDVKNERLCDALDMLAGQVLGVVADEWYTADWMYLNGCLILASWTDVFQAELLGETRTYYLPDAIEMSPELEFDFKAHVPDGWMDDGTGSGDYAQLGRLVLVHQEPRHHAAIASWFQSLDPQTSVAPGLRDRSLTRRQQEIRAALMERIDLSLSNVPPGEVVEQILKEIGVQSYFPHDTLPAEAANVDIQATNMPRIEILREALSDDYWTAAMVGERVWIYHKQRRHAGLLGRFRTREVYLDDFLFVPLQDPDNSDQ